MGRKRFTPEQVITMLWEAALIGEKSGPALSYRLDRSYKTALRVRIGARGLTWFVIE